MGRSIEPLAYKGTRYHALIRVWTLSLIPYKGTRKHALIRLGSLAGLPASALSTKQPRPLSNVTARSGRGGVMSHTVRPLLFSYSGMQ